MRHSWIVIAAASVIFAACTHPALSRFRTEHDCSSATIRDLGAFAYQVEGCGRTVNYVCDPRNRPPGQAICFEESSRFTPSVRASRSVYRSADRLRLEEGAVRGSTAVRLAIPQLLGAALVYAPEVDRAHVVAQIPERVAAQCEDARIGADNAVLVATRRPPPANGFAWERESLDVVDRGALVAITFCGRRLDVLAADLRVLRRFIARARELAAGGGARAEAPVATPSVPAPPAPAALSAGAATRAWLDASRDVILGCAGRETVIVRVEAREGGTAVSLQPPLAGGPEEACVRSALGDPPAGAAPQGVVIHAVR